MWIASRRYTLPFAAVSAKPLLEAYELNISVLSEKSEVPSSILSLFPVTLKEFKSNFSLEKNEHLIWKELETLFEIINYMIWSNDS